MAFAKRASDHIPYCHDQGIPYLAGAGSSGFSMQAFQVTDPGAVLFANLGLSNMADANYFVICTNHTDPADQAYVSARSATGLTIAGSDASDVVDVLVIGRLDGQVAP